MMSRLNPGNNGCPVSIDKKEYKLNQCSDHQILGGMGTSKLPKLLRMSANSQFSVRVARNVVEDH